MKLHHIADSHFRRDNFNEAKASIDTLRADIEKNGSDLVVISGDTWDGPIQNTAGARFADFLGLIQGLADLAPVAMIYGTPSHDTEGSLEVFESLEARHRITILRPGFPYFLSLTGHIEAEPWSKENPVVRGQATALLFGVPEPNKKWLLANAGATGKDEADTAAHNALQGLFLGLGGMRQEHPNLPCVLLYHGQVLGAKSGTGYAAASGLAVTRDDLAMVGADYIALGDIHEPQQIGDLPAYYPGSIYPLDWGETHKAGCNVVEIEGDAEGWARAITRLDFPHPQRVKIARKPGDGLAYQVLPIADRMVWEEWTMTQEEASGFDETSELEGLMVCGALEGSKVTRYTLPTETVRAGEITEASSLPEKIAIWADASSLAVPPSVIIKASELEREASVAGSGATGAHIRIDRLILRGAIGIWKKSKKDEVELDLEALGPGVLALVGPNGAGKTTILENLHPWLQMLTRGGALKDHFRLKDSCRDLYFTDERTGWRYRALISIRADIASGSAEYYLYRDQGSGFEPLPGINGRKEPYEAAVSELFGSLEMYLRTAFVTQRPSKAAPDLGEATKGERKALFGELAGIDYLDRYREAAKARADAAESEFRTLHATVAAAAGVDEEIAALLADIAFQESKAAAAEKRAQEVRGQGNAARAAVDEARGVVQGLERSEDRRTQLEREITTLLAEVRQAEGAIALFQGAAGRRGNAEAQIVAAEKLTAEAGELRRQREAASARDRKAVDEFRTQQEGLRLSGETLRADLDRARKGEAATAQALAVARARLQAPVADTCPTCGQTLPGDRLEALRHAHEEAESVVARAEEEHNLAAAALASAKAAYEAAAAEFSAQKPPPPEPFPGAGRLAEIEADLAFTDLPSLRETIRKADEATVRIEEASRRIASGNSEAAAKRETIAALERELSGLPAARADLSAKEACLEELRSAYTAAKAEAAAGEEGARAGARSLQAANTRQASRDAAAAKLEAVAAELADWRFIERAVGADGIQALELDALAPSISAVANRILSEAYGSRYQIEFRTTRIAGKGSKTKQVEDFEIFILDTETGDEQTIDSLSGGEAVWIRKALYDGFAVIRAKNTGTRFQTVFLDEADGALDPEARMLYLRMLEAAHREAGRFQTILISHSTEIQAMVDVIDVASLGARKAVTA